jgi:hypothetical protein
VFGSARMEPLLWLLSDGRLLASTVNIRLGRKWLKVANTIAYYDIVTAVKSFIVQAPGENWNSGWMDSKKEKEIWENFNGMDKETKRYVEKGKDVEKKTA